MSDSAPKVSKFPAPQKSTVIWAFRNADKHHKGVKIVLKNFKNFEQLLLELSKQVGVPTGPVKQVFTPEGKLVKRLEDFEDGAKYIAAGAEKLDKELMPVAIKDPEAAEAPTEPAPVAKPPAVKKGPVVKAYASGSPSKFGTQAEKARVIYVFRNGDKHDKGHKVAVHSTKFKSFDQLLQTLSGTVRLPTGAVRQLFTPDGKAIKKLEDIEDEAKYVACGAEKLKSDLLPNALTGAEDEPEPAQSEPASKPAAERPKGPIVKAYAGGAPKKFGLQAEKAKVIYVFRNADKNHQGYKMAIHSTKFKNLDQVKGFMSRQVGVPTGPVRFVYSEDGRLIKSMEEFEDEGRYICTGAEKLDKEKMPIALKSPAPKKDKKEENGKEEEEGASDDANNSDPAAAAPASQDNSAN